MAPHKSAFTSSTRFSSRTPSIWFLHYRNSVFVGSFVLEPVCTILIVFRIHHFHIIAAYRIAAIIAPSTSDVFSIETPRSLIVSSLRLGCSKCRRNKRTAIAKEPFHVLARHKFLCFWFELYTECLRRRWGTVFFSTTKYVMNSKYSQYCTLRVSATIA